MDRGPDVYILAGRLNLSDAELSSPTEAPAETTWRLDLTLCCEQGGGPGLRHSLSHYSPVPNKPYGFCGRTAP